LSFFSLNETYYQRAYGHLTYEGDLFFLPVKNETLFDMASVSKVVGTTSAIMMLYEEGKLSISDSIIKYIPEMNNNGKDKITIKNLLLHNAGLAPDYPFVPIDNFKGVTS
jgi:CubicO group peptidase (beta-lactamase class C family)